MYIIACLSSLGIFKVCWENIKYTKMAIIKILIISKNVETLDSYTLLLYWLDSTMTSENSLVSSSPRI